MLLRVLMPVALHNYNLSIDLPLSWVGEICWSNLPRVTLNVEAFVKVRESIKMSWLSADVVTLEHCEETG